MFFVLLRLLAGLVLLVIGAGVMAELQAQEQPRRFRDAKQLWGYRNAEQRVVIEPRFIGAGEFRGGQAPVKDAEGFALIDATGRIVRRFALDSIGAPLKPIPPPANACAWSPSPDFSKGFACYVKQLRGSAPVVGGEIAIHPQRGEGFRMAIAMQLANGAVVVEDISYEGYLRRVLLPGVTEASAREWQEKLYPEQPMKDGCSESWTSGAVQGGAFIQQQAGC